MSTVIDSLEKQDLQKRPSFSAGDRVRVHFQVVEGSRKRTQLFEGIVIKRQGSGVRETFTVRKNSFGVGVERTFPLHSPKIEKLEVAARGDVRRAKLYYLRDKVGKQARVAERRWGIEDDLVIAGEETDAVDAEGVAISEADAETVSGDGDGEAEGEQPKADEAEQPKAEQPKAEADAPDDAAAGAEEPAPDDAEAASEGEQPASSEKAEG